MCSYCNKPGHNDKECYTKHPHLNPRRNPTKGKGDKGKDGKGNPNPNGKNGKGKGGFKEFEAKATCHNCGEKGHIKPNCPKLKKGNSNSSGNPNPIGSAQASSISDKAIADLFSRIKSGEVKFMNHVKVISSSTMPPRALSRPRMPKRPPVGMAPATPDFPIFPMEPLQDTTTSTTINVGDTHSYDGSCGLSILGDFVNNGSLSSDGTSLHGSSTPHDATTRDEAINQVLDPLDLEATVGPTLMAGLGGQRDFSRSPLYPWENTLGSAGLASSKQFNSSL